MAKKASKSVNTQCIEAVLVQDDKGNWAIGGESSQEIRTKKEAERFADDWSLNYSFRGVIKYKLLRIYLKEEKEEDEYIRVEEYE